MELEAGEGDARASLEPRPARVAGRQGFQRLYDLAERVVPPEILDDPGARREPSGCARSRSGRSRARGALTAAGDRASTGG